MLERRASNNTALSEAQEKFGLTPRERETIQLLMEGLTSKEIAERMKISPSTVKAFLRLVMVKMSVSTRSGIVGKILGSRPHSAGSKLTN
jgi:DNA-binding CsgD family transcriptional regulator